jgi:hypothetical protein
MIRLLAALLVCGCGGGDREANTKWGGMSEEEWRKQYQERQEAEAREEAEAKKRAEKRKSVQKEMPALADPTQKNLMQDAGAIESQRLPAGQKPTTENEPAFPPLPDAIADWTERDYVNARAQGAAILVPAVKYLGEQSVGDERAAKLLAKLLQPPQDLDDDTTGRRPGRQQARRDSGELIEAIVAGLGINGTDAARQTLHQLISGEFESEDNRTAALGAVKALVNNLSPENEEVLFGILTNEDAAPLRARGKTRPGELRRLAFDLLQPVATSRFRLRIAHWMVDPTTTPELREYLSKLVDPAHPDGLEASVFLLVSELTPATTKAIIMEHFTSYSSQVLGFTLRGANKSRTGTLTSDKSPGFSAQSQEPVRALSRVSSLPEPLASRADLEWHRRVISQLWNPEFSGFLERALSRVVSFNEGGEAAVLAATMPTDRARAALYQALSRHWTDGPVALDSAGLADRLVADPGFVVLVQMLVCEEIPAAKRNLTQSSSTRLRWIKAAHKVWHGELAGIAEAWFDYLDNLQSAMCKRCLASARRSEAANRLAAHDNGSPARLRNLPLDLHANPQIVAAYCLDWAHEIGQVLPTATADPMQLHYVRIEENTRPVKMLGFYRRRLASCKEREIEHGFSLESLHTDIETGQKRSVTVRVTQAMPEIPRLPNQEQPLIVEILSIAMNDPSDPPRTTATLTEN